MDSSGPSGASLFSSTLSSAVHATKESTLFPSLLSLAPRVEALLSLSPSLLNLPSPLPHEDPFLRRLSLRFSRRARDIPLVMALRTFLVSWLARSRRRYGQTDRDDFGLLQQVSAAPLIPSVLLVPAATPRRSSPIPPIRNVVPKIIFALSIIGGRRRTDWWWLPGGTPLYRRTFVVMAQWQAKLRLIQIDIQPPPTERGGAEGRFGAKITLKLAVVSPSISFYPMLQITD